MQTLSVTQLVRKMKIALQFEVGECWVEGEVSNLRVQRSGHRYFSIKDAESQLPCVLFKGKAGKQKELIADGVKVKLFGEVTIYEAMGRAQMIVSKVEIGGTGDLQTKFEELKQRLNQEGLFAKEHKRPLPAFPRKIGLITSASSAALQDMINVFSRRAPWVEYYLCGVQVQGKGAEHGIVKAIEAFNDPATSQLPTVDVLILARGGGSIEDLWNFNEEVVARAIYASQIPIVSGVGHEIDFTIADFAADHRAPTPSAAAEVTVPDKEEISSELRHLKHRLSKSSEDSIERLQVSIQHLKQRLLNKSPERLYTEKLQRIGDLEERLHRAYRTTLQIQQTQLTHLKKQLSYHTPQHVIQSRTEELETLKNSLKNEAMSSIVHKQESLASYKDLLKVLGPESTLARGYSITTYEDGTIASKDTLQAGQRVKTTLKDGSFYSTVD